MFSRDEMVSLYEFLRGTGEGPLRKMLVSGKVTEAHFRILLKVVRGTTLDEFVSAMENDQFPKIRFSPQETKLKENFWNCCCEAFISVGLLSKGSGPTPKEDKIAA